MADLESQIISKIKFINEKKLINTSNITNDDFCLIFKQIRLLFGIIADLIKFSILKIDEPLYKKVEDEKVMYPKDINSLAVIMGIYNKAFSDFIKESLFNLVDLSYYKDLYNISQIDPLMIPFVVDDESINKNKLFIDYNDFVNNIRSLVCSILDVNTNFKHESIMD
jgi:hypothetical protein